MAEPDDEFDRPFDDHERDLKRDTERLRRLARYQRWLIAVVLGQLVVWLGFIVLMVLGREIGRDPMRLPMMLTVVLNGIGAIFLALTMVELGRPLGATIFGFAALFPCIGLLIITLVNSYATTELQKHGVKVGLFGANLADIENRPSPYDIDEDAGW
jgi:hypothetical protein